MEALHQYKGGTQPVIPRDYITEWRSHAPWVEDFQVEQDLAVSRALVAIFSEPMLHEALAFRGGTALYKLHLKPPARYSEDIDLVQKKAEPAGPMMEVLRAVLDPCLGKPRWKQTEGRVTFLYISWATHPIRRSVLWGERLEAPRRALGGSLRSA